MKIKRRKEYYFPEKLIKFLKEENALDLFIGNNPYSKATNISQAFVWVQTRQGAVFWGKLHSKYYRLINEEEFK